MGVISFYDVAKAVVDSQDFENRMLKAYIRDWPVDERASAESSHDRLVARGRQSRRSAMRRVAPLGAARTRRRHVRQHLRPPVPRHQLRREPRPGDRLRDRRLPARAWRCREADIQPDLDRRRPGTSRHVTQRNEADAVEILSGVYEGMTTGTPICLLIRNTDQRSKDYGNIARHLPPRPRRLHLLAASTACATRAAAGAPRRA